MHYAWREEDGEYYIFVNEKTFVCACEDQKTADWLCCVLNNHCC